jgi:hypothetical protein
MEKIYFNLTKQNSKVNMPLVEWNGNPDFKDIKDVEVFFKDNMETLMNPISVKNDWTLNYVSFYVKDLYYFCFIKEICLHK